MEIAQLIMFKAVADHGSVVRASELLHCVPSNITNRIRRLEEELGVALFIRKGRGLIVSPSGRIFLNYTNKIISLSDEARRALAPEANPSGLLKIGAIESVASGRLPALLAKYGKRCPGVQLEFSTGVWSQLLTDVVAHELDGAVVAVSTDHPDVSQVAIYAEDLMIITSSQAGDIVTPQDFMGSRAFLWPEGCPYRKSFESWLERHQVTVSVTSIASYGTILGCVDAGAGFSLVPRGMFDQFNRAGSYRGYLFEDLAPVQNYFIWNRRVELNNARDQFAALMRAEFGALL